MTAAKLSHPISEALEQHIAAACARVAPTWPLDQFIAVNPYWGWVGQPIEVAASTLGALAGTRLTMPRSWFQAEWAAGRRFQHMDEAQQAELTTRIKQSFLEKMAQKLARYSQQRLIYLPAQYDAPGQVTLP